MYSANKTEGKLLHLRLFLEGREVPVISANIMETLNAPAQAEIQIPATAAALQLRPRTNVLLFYYEPRAKDYCVCFIGELVGVSYSKTDSSRSISLQCMDHTTYWDIAFAYYFKAAQSSTLDNLVKNRALFIQATQVNSFDDITAGAAIAALLKEAPVTTGLKDIRGIPGGLIRVFEYLLTGFAKDGSIQVLNSFFSYANIKNRLLQQISGMPFDDTATALFSAEALTEFLNNGVLSNEDVINFSSLVQYVNRFTNYQHFPIMRPKIESAAIETFVTGNAASVADRVKQDLEQKVAVLEELVNGGNYSSAAEAADDVALGVLNVVNGDYSGLDTQESQWVKKYIDTIQVLSDSIVASFQEGKPLEIIKPSVDRLVADSAQLFDASGKKDYSRGLRLHSRVLAPNLFFAPAPRCNVIFPEYYNNLRFNRSLVNETTRLEMKTHILSTNLKASTVEGLQVVYAPSITRTEDPAIVNEDLFNVLPHEKHSGIVPKFSSFGNRLEVDSAQTTGSQTRTMTETAQNIADYEFFYSRLSGRTLDVSGRFNPDIVVGLPCVVLDNPNVPPSITTVEDIKKNGAVLQQFVGSVYNITHFISQNEGANTSVTLNCVRSHRGEDDEIIRDIIKRRAQEIADKKVEESKNKIAEVSEDAAKAVVELALPGEELQPGEVDAATIEQQEVAAAALASLQAEADKATQEYKEAVASQSMEAVLRPAWMSDNFSNEKIGETFYEFILGVRSIVDVVSKADRSVFGDQDVTIENAVDYLTLRYAKQQAAQATTRFAENYTYRPVATLAQMLDPKEGFFGPVFDPAKGLVPVEGSIPLEFNKEQCAQELAAAAASVDVRDEKIAAINAYLSSIRDRGLRN
jgi:hypothetical protein